MTRTTDDKSTRAVLEARLPGLGIGAAVPRQSKVALSNDPVERKLRVHVDAGKRKHSKIEENRPNPRDDVTSDEYDEAESRSKHLLRRKRWACPKLYKQLEKHK